MLTNLLTDDLSATRDLFVKLLDFEIEFEADWFVSMSNGDNRVAALLRTSEFIPKTHQNTAKGVLVTIIVDDVEPYFAKAKSLKLDILEDPTDLPYGQRRLLLLDASGAMIDVSSPTASLSSQYS